MNAMNERVILASASPRRKELLHRIFDDFEIIPADVEETVPDGLPADCQAEYLSGLKAAALAERYPDALVIGSDTTVILGEEVMGKPADAADACRMLQELSGRVHHVCTGCTVICHGIRRSFTEKVEVEFYPMTGQEIEDYVRSGDPMDKAGAYGIQNQGGLYVKAIRGDYNAVIGLPVARLYHVIREILHEKNGIA